MGSFAAIFHAFETRKQSERSAGVARKENMWMKSSGGKARAGSVGGSEASEGALEGDRETLRDVFERVLGDIVSDLKV